MPPVTKAGGTQFRKDVEFSAVKDSDEYELEATGIVMVPGKADLQNDFAREDTIQEFAEQFATFEEAGQAGGGIMHATWPDGWMELERNEVLDDPEEIAGETVDAGAWVQRWGITNGELAALIDDNILSGYSIGAIQVDWDGPYDPEEVDDVDTSEIPDGEVVYELTDGLIREVSAVDIPAVPDAQILEAKGLEKRLAEHVGNQDAFIEEAMERGHSEGEAEQLWDILNEAMEADGASEPGKQSMFAKAGKAFLSALSGTDDDGGSEAPDRGANTAETPEEDPRGTSKEGRTLSRQNRESLYATIDASLDVLEDAGEVPEDMGRFTDREDTSFDLSEHTAREWPDPDDEEETDVSVPGMENNAPEGDTSDNTTEMGDDTKPEDEPPEWVKELQEQINEQSKRIDEVLDGDEEKAAGGPDGEDPWDDAPEWALELKQSQAENAERIDDISKQTATGSQQLGKAAEEQGEKDSEFTLDPRKAQGGN
jgi:hypothetical protein